MAGNSLGRACGNGPTAAAHVSSHTGWTVVRAGEAEIEEVADCGATGVQRERGMMKEPFLRSAARRLMAFAVRICPAENRQWAEAMATEAEYVESPFKALLWAMGCIGWCCGGFACRY